MKLIAKRMRFTTVALTWLLVLSLSWGALAQGAASPPITQAPWFPDDSGAVPLTDEEMAEVSGELSNIVVGAIGGAVASGVNYLLSPGEKSVGEFLYETAKGALGGAIGGAGATLHAASTAVKAVETVEKASKVAQTVVASAWAAWAGANGGAFVAAIEHIVDQLRKK